jgi:hypothetical protein
MEIGRYSGSSPPSTRIVLMDTIMGFFDIEEAGAQEEEIERPGPFALFAPRPNPARGPVTLTFALPECGPVDLRVYDASGRRVQTLIEGEMDAGEHVARWSGRDEHGRRVATGIYFARLSSRNQGSVRKIILLR